jgi:quercetin dioxygenase-like cupin family protein
MGAFSDKRGEIRDLLEDDGAVTRITTVAGAIRGNHFHKKTWQVVVVTKGSLEVFSRKPGSRVQWHVLNVGEAEVNPPGEMHAWRALEDSECLVFAVGPRTGQNYENDVYRLLDPLV